MESMKELGFMVKVLGRMGIGTHFWPRDREDIGSFDLGMRHFVDRDRDYHDYIGEYSRLAEDGVLYFLRDDYGASYLFFTLPGETRSFLLIGPFSTERPGKTFLLESAKRHGVDMARLDGFLRIYERMPVVRDRDMLIALVTSCMSLLFGKEDVPLRELRSRDGRPREPLRDIRESVDLMVTERDYRAENALMDAVARGDAETVSHMVSRFDFRNMDERSPDPVRNMKNWGVIMNTLLRKAAEKGSVHPVWLDRVSSDAAAALESAPTVGEVEKILRELPERYLVLVRKESLRGKSKLVRRAMMMTAEGMGEPMSTGIIAGKLGADPSYLSRIFRRETGRTLSEHIREERVRYGESLLKNTDLSVEMVAEWCGYPDMCYFSRVFRAVTGMSPSEARKRQ